MAEILRLEREFYIRMSERFGWTKSVSISQIKNKTHKKTLAGQTNFEGAFPESLRRQAKLAVKNE